MKKLFITALFAILMGGFAFTANAQEVKTGKTTNLEQSKSKVGNQDNKESLQANEYQGKVDAFQAAVNEFVNAYKAGDKNVSEKNKPVDLEKLLATAEKARDDVQPYYEKLSKSQKETFDKANKELERTRAKFYQK